MSDINTELGKESLHISLVTLASELCGCNSSDLIMKSNEELERIIQEKLS